MSDNTKEIQKIDKKFRIDPFYWWGKVRPEMGMKCKFLRRYQNDFILGTGTIIGTHITKSESGEDVLKFHVCVGTDPHKLVLFLPITSLTFSDEDETKLAEIFESDDEIIYEHESKM